MGEAAAKRERDLSIDIMNILACISVICLHHNGLVHSFADTLGWRQSLVVECVCYWAVPVFLMISGANLMNYREKYSTTDFFRKRIIRTVIPWLFWSIVILLLNTRLGILEIDPPTLKQAIYLIVNNKVESVYWYFDALFACYLAIPVLSLLCSSRAILWYIFGLNFIFLSVRPVLNTWLDFSWGLDVPVVGSCIIFVILGYLLNPREFTRRQRYLLYLAGIAGLVFRFVYTLHFSVLNQTTDTSIKGYNIFHSVLYAAAVFVFLKHVPWNRCLPGWLKKWVPAISACSFGIYLIHRRVMYFEMEFLNLGNGHLIWRTLCIPLTYLISLGIVMIIRKIPVIKNVVGG